MKRTKYFIEIMLLMIFSMVLYSCIGPVPVDVVMIDNELFFVLEEPYKIQFLRVRAVPEKGTE